MFPSLETPANTTSAPTNVLWCTAASDHTLANTARTQSRYRAQLLAPLVPVSGYQRLYRTHTNHQAAVTTRPTYRSPISVPIDLGITGLTPVAKHDAYTTRITGTQPNLYSTSMNTGYTSVYTLDYLPVVDMQTPRPCLSTLTRQDFTQPSAHRAGLPNNWYVSLDPKGGRRLPR